MPVAVTDGGGPMMAIRGLDGLVWREPCGLHGVDLDIREGRSAPCSAANGAGKTTTLLRSIMGLVPHAQRLDPFRRAAS